MEYKNYLKKNKCLIAMIHVKAMPGTPRNKLSSKKIIKNQKKADFLRIKNANFQI